MHTDTAVIPHRGSYLNVCHVWNGDERLYTFAVDVDGSLLWRINVNGDVIHE